MASRTDTPNEARAAARRVAMAPSTLRSRDRLVADVTVIDLSATGIRIVTEPTLEVGEEISIGLPGVGTRRAFVAWSRDGEHGCAFLRPLEAQEATMAFASASVVRLGTVSAASATPPKTGKAELEELYGHHGLWRLPLDAVITFAGYCALLSWGAWRILFGG